MAFTFAVSTNSSLSGTTNFLLTKDASTNYQGKGISYPFSIDQGDQGKVLQGSFDYRIDSGTYTSGDLTVWVYDVTNAKLIQPAPYIIQSHSLPSEKFFFEFQTSINSTSYRLIIHQSTATINNYTIRFDNFNVARTAKMYGSPITDWVSYTPTIVSGAGTISATITGKYRRLGDSLQIQVQYSYTSGTGAAAQFELSLPSGVTPDSTKMNTTGHVGSGWWYTTATGFKNTDVRINGSNIYFTKDSVAGFLQGTDADDAGAGVIIQAVIPVTGWSSSQVMSSDADTRVVSFSGTKGSTQSVTASTTDITFTTSKDSHGAWTGSVYNVLSPGDYQVSFAAMIDNGAGSDEFIIYKNGTATAARFPLSSSTSRTGGSILLTNMIAGDTISLRCLQTTTLAASGILTIHKISGPAQIAASESVSARYTTSANTSTANGTLIPFDTIDYDSHGAVTTGASWKFTAPMSGLYDVNAMFNTTTASNTAGTYLGLILYKNGSSTSKYVCLQYVQSASTISYSAKGSIKVKLLAGEYIQLKTSENLTSDPNLDGSVGLNYIEITRVGNY